MDYRLPFSAKEIEGILNKYDEIEKEVIQLRAEIEQLKQNESSGNTKTVDSISAVFDSGSNIITVGSKLDKLRQYLTVTATYNDSSSEEITDYTLSGSINQGNNTITVSYEGKTTTFEVFGVKLV